MPEAATTEACCGAGGAALRWGYMAVASGIYETVVVAGVEAMIHADKYGLPSLSPLLLHLHINPASPSLPRLGSYTLFKLEMVPHSPPSN
jgi:acetyl-CoA acetyltransferase